jgi:hypothetical protein
MSKIRVALVLAAFLLLLPSLANAQCSSSTPLPPGTVLGRLLAGPGPCQAIPFATLNSNLVGNAFIQFTGPGAPTKTFTLPNASDTIAALGQIQIWTGAQSFTDGKLILLGLTSGSTTLKAPATGGGTATLFPGSDTILGAASTATLTNKTFDTAGAGNSLSINGVAATANTGTGSVVRATSPTLVTPAIGAATATSINGNFFTAGTYTLAGAAGKTFTFNNSLTFVGTDGTTQTFQASDTIVGRATTDTLTNKTFVCANQTSCVIRLGSDVTGTLLAAQEPAHTGDVTNTAGSLALAYTNVVPTNKGGAGAVTGALRADGAGNVSQAAMADISNYAQGTWTPTLIGSTSGSFTLNISVGSYEKIGRFIRASFVINSTANGAVGNVLIGGLPFTSGATSNDNGTCSIASMVGVTLTASFTQLTGEIFQSTTQVTLLEIGSGQTGQQAATAKFAAAITLAGTCLYHN